MICEFLWMAFHLCHIHVNYLNSWNKHKCLEIRNGQTSNNNMFLFICDNFVTLWPQAALIIMIMVLIIVCSSSECVTRCYKRFASICSISSFHNLTGYEWCLYPRLTCVSCYLPVGGDAEIKESKLVFICLGHDFKII